jgi:septal ring factor EnvC (AmiA/AmiB activator)
MIIQQVNLYRDSLKPKQRSRFFYAVIALGLVFFVSVGLVDILLMKNLHNRQNSIEQKRQVLVMEQERVKVLEASLPKQESDSALTEQLTQWQKKVESLKLTIALLNTDNTARSQGFSAYFQALANQAVSGVWLTMIHFDAEQQRIDFEGSTLKNDSVPYFLQQLQQESVFQGHSFVQLQMDRSEQAPNLMNFKLSTHLEPINKGKNVQ